jgi:hypothetical protein
MDPLPRTGSRNYSAAILQCQLRNMGSPVSGAPVLNQEPGLAFGEILDQTTLVACYRDTVGYFVALMGFFSPRFLPSILLPNR